MVFSLFTAGQPLVGHGGRWSSAVPRSFVYGSATLAGLALPVPWRGGHVAVRGVPARSTRFRSASPTTPPPTCWSSGPARATTCWRRPRWTRTHAFDTTLHAAGWHRTASCLTVSRSRRAALRHRAVLDLARPPSAPLTAGAAGRRPRPARSPLREVIARRERPARALKVQRARRSRLLSYAGLARVRAAGAGVDVPFDVRRLADAITATFLALCTGPTFQCGLLPDRRRRTCHHPGFKVSIGLANYSRMLLDADFRGPFVSIFVWTVVFAGADRGVRGQPGSWRWRCCSTGTRCHIKHAVPHAAVPALRRAGLHLDPGVQGPVQPELRRDQRQILHGLFGIRPAWFADPLLAKAMLLIVNTWLGFPYFMILCAGSSSRCPADLYEASALAGAKPLDNFFRITAPLILKPLTPLLISGLRVQLQQLRADLRCSPTAGPTSSTPSCPAGTTDILVSYTYRIAFTDAGQNFGLAGGHLDHHLRAGGADGADAAQGHAEGERLNPGGKSQRWQLTSCGR